MSRPPLPVEGSTALVTSSSRTLGAEIARSLAGQGVRVAINYHASQEAAGRLADEIRELGHPPPVLVWGDTSTASGAAALVEAAAKALDGRLDILVNNSGPFAWTPLRDLSFSEWSRVIDGNLTSVFAASQAAHHLMRREGRGRIVNVAAVSGFRRSHSVYGLAKNALMVLTEQLALEFAPHVTVNAVAPAQLADSLHEMAVLDPGFAERVAAAAPAGRLVSRSEVATIVRMLCGPEFDMVTGVTIPVDGGLRLVSV